MGLLGRAARQVMRPMRQRGIAELPPYSAIRTGEAVDPGVQQAQDWLNLAGSPEKALQWADEELRFFQLMGDTDTVAKMQGAQAYLRQMIGMPGGSA